MPMALSRTKLVVADPGAAERFYHGLGFTTVRTTLGGEGPMRQEQRWLADAAEPGVCRLSLMHFPELPPPATPAYPNEVWLVLTVPDVDAIVAAVLAGGGGVISPARDEPDFGVRAAVTHDPWGHVIEFTGPMPGR